MHNENKQQACIEEAGNIIHSYSLPTRHYGLKRLLIALAALFIILLSSIILHTTTPRTYKFKEVTCAGFSTPELEERCNFDIISLSWLPHECYDAQLSAEFESIRTWEYYYDDLAEHIVPFDEVRVGLNARDVRDGSFGRLGWYSTWEQHLHHCIFIWRKLERATASSEMVDELSASEEHAKHCGMQLMEASSRNISLGTVNTLIEFKQLSCKYL